MSASTPMFDLQPDPRILPMLGEISLIQWRCIAELVDNSVDSFIAASRDGAPVDKPEVHVSLPTTDDPAARIVVRDYGRGMDTATLEHAVRAGWTGNDPIGSLGLFGMGFNIATARLGTVTRVWTTRAGDPEWTGLEIDFEALLRQGHFLTPSLSRPKTDRQECGTEVSIERLKPEQRAWFSRTANRSRVAREVGRAYSAMLRANGVPISFELYINRVRVQGREPCTWNPDRYVQHPRFGPISAVQRIDARLGNRPFCARCWKWIAAAETACPQCGLDDKVIVRERRVHGWIGLQRYLSSNDYGIDFLRNGRKIEIENRDLFTWSPDGSTSEVEYPIDDPRNRGRLIGEIHIDHCRVTYTKDRLDRNDPAWDEMVRVVRGEGPLRPDKAAELGSPPNSSPLFLLFQAFRRSSPKPRVAGSYARLLVVPDNDRAEEMARRFYDGEAEYREDTKWWELVEEADRQLLVPAMRPSPPAAMGGTATAAAEDPVAAVLGPATAVAEPPAPPRTAIASLSREYRDDITGLRWDVLAYRVDPSEPHLLGGPWALRALPSGPHEFLIDTAHAVFRSATMTPLDALLAQLASSAIEVSRGAANLNFGHILAGVRDKYAQTMRLDPAVLAGEAAMTLAAVAACVAERMSAEDAQALYAELSLVERDAIEHKMAVRSVRDPQAAVAQGKFLSFAPGKTLLRLFQAHPDLFFDGKCWDDTYSELTYTPGPALEEARAQLVSYYASLLTDAIWLVEREPDDLAEASRERLLRADLALELIAPARGGGPVDR